MISVIRTHGQIEQVSIYDADVVKIKRVGRWEHWVDISDRGVTRRFIIRAGGDDHDTNEIHMEEQA